MAEHVMRAKLTGTRDGEDWPAVGQPVPESVTGDELDGLVASGHVVKADTPKTGQLPEPETAVAPEPEKRRR